MNDTIKDTVRATPYPTIARFSAELAIALETVVSGMTPFAVQYFLVQPSRQQNSPSLAFRHSSPTVEHSSIGFNGSGDVHPTRSPDGHCKKRWGYQISSFD